MIGIQQHLQVHYLAVCVQSVMYSDDIPLMGVSFGDGALLVGVSLGSALLVGVSLGGGPLIVGHSIQFTVKCTTYTEMKQCM